MMKRLRRHPEATLIILVIVVVGIAGLATFIRASSEAESGWRGIIPGQTTESEVVALWGQPNKIIQCNLAKVDYFVYSDVRDWKIVEPCLFSPLIYEYHQPDSRATHQIHFRDNLVWLIIENASDAANYDEFLIEDVIAKYGWREKEKRSRKWEIEHFIYCEQGVIIAHNNYQALMRFYFNPTDTFTCDRDFFLYFISRDERAYSFDLKQQVDQPGVVIKK